MALNSSGPISLAGATAGQSIAVELGASATGQISLNDTNVRTLAGVASGAITMPTNFYGKSTSATTFTLGATTNVGSGSNSGYFTAGRISNTSALIVYNGNYDPKSGTLSVWARLVNISGTTVTTNGTASELFAGYSQDLGRIRGLTIIDSTYSLLSLGSGGLHLLKITGTSVARVGSAIGGGSTFSIGRVQGILSSTTYLVGAAEWTAGTVRATVVTRSGDNISNVSWSSLSTGGLTSNAGYNIGAAAGSSTTGVVSYNNRVYPVTVSGTTATISGGYLTATGGYSNHGCCVSAITPTANRYLVTANGLAGDNVGCLIFDQSGSTLTGYTGRNFSFIAGRVPASSFSRMMNGSSTLASARGEYGNPFVMNISGTTISATKTNMISTDSQNNGMWDGLTSTQIIAPTAYSNTPTGVGTAS